jgi:hypothetical protein
VRTSDTIRSHFDAIRCENGGIKVLDARGNVLCIGRRQRVESDGTPSVLVSSRMLHFAKYVQLAGPTRSSDVSFRSRASSGYDTSGRPVGRR